MKKSIIVLAALLLSACGTTTVTPTVVPATTTVTATAEPAPTVDDRDARVAVYQTYVDHVEAFADVNDRVQSATSLDDYASSCTDLSTWAEEGLTLEDINISDADTHWDAAMRAYKKAGALCVRATVTNDIDLIERSVALIAEGADEIDKATNALGEGL